ncbi:MAG TPA: ATP-binding protein [Ktedonobacteraceae bacterium]|nr:ATP-binding protein [Ktedonobacteraceae bacterium]
MGTPKQVPAEVAETTAQSSPGSFSEQEESKDQHVEPHRIVRLYQKMLRWLQANTFAPTFFTGPWSHPIFGYLIAILAQVVIGLVLLTLIRTYPSFRFIEGLFILISLLMALGWGAGPSIVATLVGAALLVLFILPPAFSLTLTQREDVIGLCLYLAVGLTISILASQVERARRASEQLRIRLNTIIEAIPDPLIIYDIQGRVTQHNHMAQEFNGPQQLQTPWSAATAPYDLYDADGKPLPFEEWPFSRALRGETLVGTEITYYNPVKRQQRFISVSVAPLRAPSINAIEGVVGISHDITEHKRREDALRASEERIQFIAEVSKVLSSSLDYETTLNNLALLIVPRFADWFAVDLLDQQGNIELLTLAHIDPAKVQWAKKLREKYPIDPDASQGIPQVIRTGKSELYPEVSDDMLQAAARTEEELDILRQVGYSSILVVPLVVQGRPIGAITLVFAESGRKYNTLDLAVGEEIGLRAGIAIDNARLYQEVKQARDQLDIILQGAADGIIVYNKNDQIIYANEAAMAMMGFSSFQAMLEVSSSAIVSSYEMIDEQRRPITPSQLPHHRVIAGEREAQATIGYHHKSDGEFERWSIAKARPVFDERGNIVLVISLIHDVTERVLAEQRKDEFISMASHELKTPVTSLKGFTHVLQRRLKKLQDEQGLHFLERIDAQLNKLSRLISELLDVSGMQAGKLVFQTEAFDLDGLIQETVENLQPTTSTHRLIVEGRANAQIVGDKDRLGQVFINLLTNAIKYSPQGDKVIIHASQRPGEVVISVRDFGIGISKPHQEKIFERFYRVTDEEEKTYPGLGIGLYLSYEIIKRHHGQMWVESRKGEGSTFYIALPLTKGRIEDEPSEANNRK